MNGNEQPKRLNGPQVDAGSSVAEGFGTMTAMRTAETSSSAVAAQAQAAVQARFIMAMKNPRDIEQARVKLMKECARPSFADVARYHKPIGQGVEGPSIRFAETAIRCMGNIDTSTQAIFDAPDKRIVRVTALDLESNVAFSQDVTIDKTVERSSVPRGEQPISMRTNSTGKVTYLLAATDDQLLNKENALISKAIRTLSLRLVPGDLIEEGMTKVIATQKDRDAKDPDGARRMVIDGFAKLGILPADLKAYLGHDTSTISPAELVTLRALGIAIREGQTSWKEALEMKAAGADGKVEGGLKDRVAAKVAKKPTETAKAAPAAPPPPPPPAEDEQGDANEDYGSMTDEERAAAIDAGG